MHAHSVGCGSLSWRKGGTVDGVYLWLQYQDPCLGGLLLATGTKLWASSVQKNMKQKNKEQKEPVSKQMHTEQQINQWMRMSWAWMTRTHQHHNIAWHLRHNTHEHLVSALALFTFQGHSYQNLNHLQPFMLWRSSNGLIIWRQNPQNVEHAVSIRHMRFSNE